MSWEPPWDIDPACRNLCIAMNALPGIETFGSCCGHGERKFWVYFRMDSKDLGVLILARCLSCHYSEEEKPTDPVWRVVLGRSCGLPYFVLEGKTMEADGDRYAVAEQLARNLLLFVRGDEAKVLFESAKNKQARMDDLGRKWRLRKRLRKWREQQT